jgi:hypothetical protein
MRRAAVMLMVFAVLVSGSGVAAAPATLQDTDPDAEVIEDYERLPPELCPPDGAPVEEAVLAVETESGDIALPFVNEQAEVFLITVSGVNPEAIQLYVEEARFCFDQIFSSDAIQPDESESEESEEEIAGEDLVEADVAIELEFVGLFTEADPAVVREMVAEFVASGESLVDLPIWLGEEFLDANELVERGESWVVDFFIDPPIRQSRHHLYSTKQATIANVTVTGLDGQVTARLYRVSWPTLYLKDTASVPDGSNDTLRASSLSQRTYQLCVEGDQSSNVYSLAGRWTNSSSRVEKSGDCPKGVR